MSDFADIDNIFIMDHPLIQHKISILRNKETGTNEFRKLIEEIAVLMGFEALRDLPLEDVEVETPIETCQTPMISGKKLAVVPVLRAGLGMVNGITTLVPSAKIGHKITDRIPRRAFFTFLSSTKKFVFSWHVPP